MKATAHNWLDDLSPERREEVERTIAEAGRQSDEHMRRVCSSFGYKHGYYWAMITWITLTLFVSFLGIMGFALFAPTQEMSFQAKISIMNGILSFSCLIIPVLLFVFLKARYAIRVLGVLVVVIIIGQLLFHVLDPLINAAVISLLEG
ncbi:hypothetical protein FQZ97_856980 [compost metagenome]